MKNRIVWIIALAGLVASCGLKEQNEKLQLENQEMKLELERAEMMSQTLEQIGALMDSIDGSRDVLWMDIESGTSYENYLARMEDLNKYVAETADKLNNMEKELGASEKSKKAYLGTINRLKKDLEEKTSEINLLKEQVDQYKTENQDLLTKVDLQAADLEDKELQIEQKRQELELLENRIEEIMIKSQVSQAEALFARGAAVEEAANRTKLAPKKKRATLMEALDLYRKAATYGSEEAKPKIESLEEKLKITE